LKLYFTPYYDMFKKYIFIYTLRLGVYYDS
jgi:hypothetical protein